LEGLKIRGSKKIRIGSRCFIGRNVELDASCGEIVIGNDVEIRDGARILSKGIHVGDGVTLGEGAYLNGSLDIATGAWISRGCDLTGDIKIEKAILGPHVAVIAGE
jgi:acetyltransferase-like isoleucine patch superfamily enzyme